MPGSEEVDTRRRVLTAAIELLRDGGFHAMGMKALVERARATTGSVYHFFPGGKSEVAATAVRDAGAAYLQLFELIAAGAPDAEGAIREFFDGAAGALEEQAFRDLCPVTTVAAETATSDDAVRRAAAAVFDTWIDAVATRLTADGVAPSRASALARTIIAALEGGFVLARTSRDASGLRATGEHMAHLVRAEVARPRARTRR